MRDLLDLSLLIEIQRPRRLPELRRLIRDNKIAMVNFSLKKLKSTRWKDWLDRNRHSIEVRLNPGDEQRRYAELVRDHCGRASNPRLDPDDVMAITIAAARGWRLAMRDRTAVAVATALGVKCIELEELLSRPQQGRLL